MGRNRVCLADRRRDAARTVMRRKLELEELRGEMSTAEVAQYLGVSVKSVGNWAANNEIPSRLNPAGKRKYFRAEIEEYNRHFLSRT